MKNGSFFPIPRCFGYNLFENYFTFFHIKRTKAVLVVCITTIFLINHKNNLLKILL